MAPSGPGPSCSHPRVQRLHCLSLGPADSAALLRGQERQEERRPVGRERTCCVSPGVSRPGTGARQLICRYWLTALQEASSSSSRRLSNLGADSSLHGHVTSAPNRVPILTGHLSSLASASHQQLFRSPWKAPESRPPFSLAGKLLERTSVWDADPRTRTDGRMNSAHAGPGPASIPGILNSIQHHRKASAGHVTSRVGKHAPCSAGQHSPSGSLKAILKDRTSPEFTLQHGFTSGLPPGAGRRVGFGKLNDTRAPLPRWWTRGPKTLPAAPTDPPRRPDNPGLLSPWLWSSQKVG